MALKLTQALALVFFLLSGPLSANNATIGSAAIVGVSTDIGCMSFRVTGICIWMTCVAAVCEFDFSVKVKHRIPEAVVTAYPIIGQSPWVDTAGFSSPTAFAQEGGASTEGGDRGWEQALRFKNSDVIGSPGALVYHALADVEGSLFCRPATMGYLPYFISTNDPAWREPVAEAGWVAANALVNVGTGATNFGGLFPRIGFVDQGHDYKASLVAAKRAMDIVRQPWQPHVYVPMTGAVMGQGYWPPSEDTPFLWQQLVPEVRGCTILPDIDDTLHVLDPYSDRINQTRGNAWQVWRPYSCCSKEGAVLIFHEGN